MLPDVRATLRRKLLRTVNLQKKMLIQRLALLDGDSIAVPSGNVTPDLETNVPRWMCMKMRTCRGDREILRASCEC